MSKPRALRETALGYRPSPPHLRSLESRRLRRYKSERKRLRARLRRQSRSEEYESLLRLLDSMQRFEALNLSLEEIALASPLLQAFSSLVPNARNSRELAFLAYQELRRSFTRIDAYCKWYGKSALRLETSYQSSDIFRASGRPEHEVWCDNTTRTSSRQTTMSWREPRS